MSKKKSKKMEKSIRNEGTVSEETEKKIFTTIRKAILVVLGFLSIIIIAALSYWFFYCPAISSNKNFNAGDNAAWLQHKWFSEKKSDEEIEALVEKLKGMQIKTIFVHVGPLDSHGKIPEYSLKTWLDNYQRIRNAAPDIRIFAWLGGLNQLSYGKADDTLDLGDDMLLDSVAQSAAEMVILCRFDGIHYDMEPVPDNDQGFLKLLHLTRMKIGKTPLSVATPHIAPSDELAGIIRRRISHSAPLWSPSYYSAVAGQVDEIVLMAYDSGSPTPATYKKYLMNQVKYICNSISGSKCGFWVGIPSYDEKTAFHNPGVENISNAIKGTILGLEKTGEHKNFKGLSIYSLWTMDEKETEEFRKLWIKQPKKETTPDSQ